MLTHEEIYAQVARLIVENDWQAIRVTADKVETASDVYLPSVYFQENSSEYVDNGDWELVRAFHPSEYIDNAGHVRFAFEGDVDDLLLNDIDELLLGCVEIADLDENDSLIGWALVKSVK